MTTIRHENPFTAVPNAMLRDGSLSMEARGLLALLMSYSDGWTFRAGHLQAVTGWGRDKLAKLMAELRHHGWVELRRHMGESGKMEGSSYVLRFVQENEASRGPENPALGASTGALKNRGPENTGAVKSGHIRRTSTKKNKKEEEQAPVGANAAQLPLLSEEGQGQSKSVDLTVSVDGEPTRFRAREREAVERLAQAIPLELAAEFAVHRRGLRASLTPAAAAKILKTLCSATPEAAIAAVEQSIANGYRGVFIRAQGSSAGNGPATPAARYQEQQSRRVEAIMLRERAMEARRRAANGGDQ